MKKIIFFLLFIFTTNLNADVKEAGSDPLPTEMLENIKNSLNNKLQKYKGKEVLFYISFDKEKLQKGEIHWNSGYSSFKKINDKSHKKTYKACLKYGKKKKINDDCYLFAINDKIVWDLSKPYVGTKIANGNEQSNNIDAERDAEATPVLLETDKKPGRFFKDQPDINGDYKFHVIYTLYKDSKDKEGDINGKVEELMKIADDWTYKTTKKSNAKSNTFNGEGQRIKWDFRKDGKLDISFLRLNITKKRFKSCKYSCGNIFGRTIIKAGFNDPKKIYVNFGDFAYKDYAYSAGFPIFNVFTKMAGSTLKKNEVGYFILHESLHSMGGIFNCSPKHVNNHNTKKSSDMMSLQGDGRNMTLDPKNDDYWGHNNKSCPDMQDSVYFTPTSDTPFDPFEVTCLSKDKWKVTQHDYKNYEDSRGDGYQCFYSRSDVTASWEKEIGIYQE
jgi:hypothetical protein